MPILPGAEPFHAEGDLDGAGRVGVLLSHGFTGTPQSMRPWAEHLAAAGLTVSLPRLPGHGTRWQDMNKTRWQDWYGEVEREFDALRAKCEQVFVMGLSMGGTLVLRLAEEHGDDVAGVVVVNASVATKRLDIKYAVPIVSRVLPSLPGIGSDIKKPGVTELAYDRTPLRAVHSLSQLWKLVVRDLHKLQQPLLVFRSREDHVVEPISGEVLLRGCATNAAVEERILENSYHVATLDNDAPRIFAESLEFVRAHAPAARTAGAAER